MGSVLKLWETEPKTQELINQLKIIAKNTSDKADRNLLKITAKRLSHLQALASDTVSELQNSENTETQINALLEKGFTRHELVREYGYSKSDFNTSGETVDDLEITTLDIGEKSIPMQTESDGFI